MSGDPRIISAVDVVNVQVNWDYLPREYRTIGYERAHTTHVVLVLRDGSQVHGWSDTDVGFGHDFMVEHNGRITAVLAEATKP